MNYCNHCLNHGFNAYDSDRHRRDCRFSRCECHKCLNPVVGQEVSQVLATNQIQKTIEMNDNINTDDNRTDLKADPMLQKNETEKGTDFLSTDTLDAVRSLAEELAAIEVSDNDLQKSVLLLLLQKNELSVEETIRKLCSARRAITESLVLSAFHSNRNSSHKRRFSSLESDGSSEQLSTEEVNKKCGSSESKAKKSFPKLSLTKKSDSNDWQINRNPFKKSSALKTKDVSVQTIEQRVEKLDALTPTEKKTTTSPTIISISPKILVSTLTQTDSPIIAVKSPALVPQILRPIAPLPQMIGTSVQTNLPNLSNTYMFMPLVNTTVNTNPSLVNRIQLQMPLNPTTILPKIAIRTPVQVPQTTVHLSTNVANTKSVSMNARPISSCKPLPGTNSPQVIRLSHLTGTYNNRNNNSLLKSPKKGMKKLTTRADIKSWQLTQLAMSTSTKTNSNSASTKSSPELRTYSRMGSNVSLLKANEQTVESNSSKICAKIITSEAALKALSAISNPNSNSSFDYSNQNNLCETEEFILPDDDSVNGSASFATNGTDMTQSTPKLDKDLNTTNSYVSLNNNGVQTSTHRYSSRQHSSTKSNNPNKNQEYLQITID